jgi:serine protease inhibitor
MALQRRVRAVSGHVLVSVLLVLTCGLMGCGDGTGARADQTQTPATVPQAVALAEENKTAVDPVIVAADNAFGLNALRVLQSRNGSTNISISPLSLSLALQILYNGAVGATQRQIAEALQLESLTTQQVNDGNAALQASLIDADAQVHLKVANSLWIQSGDRAVLPSFVQMDQAYYGATIGDVAGAPDNVNAWVAGETNGLISQILAPGNYSSTIAIIANAVYFKGPWTATFDSRATVSRAFMLDNGTSEQVPMMQQQGTFSYLHGDGFQLIRLPYARGRFSMAVLLPDSGTSLTTLTSGISADQLNGWVGQMQPSYGTVALPRFTTDAAADMVPVLQQLGMVIPFTCLMPGSTSAYSLPALPDFSALSSDHICVQGVAHEARVQVDEAGTVAAAATSATVVVTAVRQPLYTMTMDHPFLYAIRDDETGLLLFIGTLADPAAK